MQRSILPIACATVGVLLLTFLLKAHAMPNQQLGKSAQQVSSTPTSTPVNPTPVFSATVMVNPSQRQIVIDEILVVTADISVNEGCSFPVREITLEQIGDDGMLFEYVSPSTHTVPFPGIPPFTYTLLAVDPGIVLFSGWAYGEVYCGSFMGSTYLHGESELVTVEEQPHRIHMPLIGKN